MEKDAATILEDAADLLLIHGRSQCTGRARSGKFCVLGAIAEAQQPGWWTDGFPWYWRVVRTDPAAVAAVAALGFPDDGAVAEWNDETADDFEVIDRLRLSAKTLRNQS